MWKTQDGYTLRLPRSRVERIGSQLSSSGLSNLIKLNYRGNLRNAVVRTIGQVARNSLRVGTLFHPEYEGEYPVFQVSVGPKDYRIISRPIGESENAILSVRPVTLESELYDVAGKATIEWRPVSTIGGAIRASGGNSNDIYVFLERDPNGNWKPYRLGRTGQANARLKKHLDALRNHKRGLKDIRVQIGHIKNAKGMTPTQIERVLIRKLKRSTTGVTNRGVEAKPIMVPQGKQVVIDHSGKSIPKALVDRRRKNKTLIIPSGKYEFEPPLNALVYA